MHCAQEMWNKIIQTAYFVEKTQLFLASGRERGYYILDILAKSPQRDIPLFVSASRETNNVPLESQWCKQQCADYINGEIQKE